jgi:hypothetical protein
MAYKAFADNAVHIILDNYAAHKHPKVRAWFDHLPLHANILLMAQRRRRLLRKTAKRRLKPGVFHSLVDLQAAINRFVAETNKNPKSISWTADPDTIFAAVRRGRQALDSFH